MSNNCLWPQCVQVCDAGHGDSAEGEAAKMSQSYDGGIMQMTKHVCSDDYLTGGWDPHGLSRDLGMYEQELAREPTMIPSCTNEDVFYLIHPCEEGGEILDVQD